MLSALRNFGITLGVGLLIFGLLAFGITRFAIKSFDGGFTATGDRDGDTNQDNNSTTQSAMKDLSNISGKTFTMLMIGVDYFPDSLSDYDTTFEAAYGRSSDMTIYSAGNVPESLCTFTKKRKITADTVLLFHVDREKQTFIVESIPYNTRVLVDGSYTKLGELINDKGMRFFLEKVEALTGLKINYHMAFTPRGFVSIMQQIGMVTFDVPCNMSYSDKSQDLSINVTAGEQQLGGLDLLKVLRYDSYADGDISRMITTRSFAVSLLGQMKNISSLENAAALYEKLDDFLYTDMATSDFSAVADLVFCYDDFNCISQLYPGSPITDGGESYYEPDVVEATNFFRDYR